MNQLSDLSMTAQAKDVNSPAYECLAYRKQIADWMYLQDVFEGAWLKRDRIGKYVCGNKQQIYLPKQPAENSTDYNTRLQASTYEDKYAQAIRKYVTLCFSAGIDRSTVHPDIDMYWENIDGQGTHGDQFVRNIAEDLQIHGVHYIFVDFSGGEAPVNLAEYRSLNRRPFWVSYKAIDVLNWRTVVVDGEVVLARVTLREHGLIADGDFGEIEIVRYRVLRLFEDGDSRTVESQIYIQDEQNKSALRMDGEPTYLSIDRIPLYPLYAGKHDDWGVCPPALKALAQLNVQYYRCKSDYDRKLHMSAVDVLATDDPNYSSGDVTLGPGAILPLTPGSTAFWLGLNTSSLPLQRTELQDLQQAIDFLDSKYLEDPSDRQAAFTTAVQMAATDSSLEMFAYGMVLGVNAAIRCTGEYLGLYPDQCGGIILNAGISRPTGTDSQMLMAFKQLVSDGLLTKRSLMGILKERGYYPEALDVQAEYEEITRMDADAAANRVPDVDAFFLQQIQGMPSLDLLSKRTFLELFTQITGLDIDIDRELKQIGEDVNLVKITHTVASPSTPDQLATVKEVARVDNAKAQK